MFPLDSKTIDRLAEVAVARDTPYERKGWELEQLLTNAGWVQVPEYDGSPKIPWLAEEMVNRREDRPALERLICRLCDPLEYDEGMPAANWFRGEVNDKLRYEQLVVTHVGGRPVLGELVGGEEATFSKPPNLDERVRALVQDNQVADGLVRRAGEAAICADSGAYTLAVIGIGSFVEGLLHAVLSEQDDEVRSNGFRDDKGGRVRDDRVTLALLIDTAHRGGWIQLDAADFMHKVRDFRNFIHPRKELVDRPDFDEDSVRLCWAPVQAVLNDVERRLTG